MDALVLGGTGPTGPLIVNGLLESGVAGRAMSLAEVEGGGVDSYQREIDAHYGLV